MAHSGGHEANALTTVTRGERLYFAAVGLLAAWVGFWGTFVPGQVDRAIPWLVPPLHARFIGAVYLSAAVILFGGLLARAYTDVRALAPFVTLWTGLLLVLSFFYLGEFDFNRKPVWVWFGAYVLYPLIGLWLIVRHRALPGRTAGPALPAWVRGTLLALGAVLSLLAVVLLVAPDFMVSVWPWKMSRMLAQIYSAPFLAYGLCSWLVSRRQTWPEVRLIAAGGFVFTGTVLIASLLHRQVFSAASPSAWVWFGGFALVAAVLGLLTALGLRARGAD